MTFRSWLLSSTSLLISRNGWCAIGFHFWEDRPRITPQTESSVSYLQTKQCANCGKWR